MLLGVILFVLAILVALRQDNIPDEETLELVALDKSHSDQELERRQYLNLLMFQQTGLVFALVIVPLAVSYYQNRQVFKRHRLRKVVKLERQSAAREISLSGRLLEKYPNLTAHELSLCKLLYRGISSKEIAIELNISPSSVNTARYRLRKRLRVPGSEELVAFLHKI